MDPLPVPPEGAEWMSACHHRLGWLVWKGLRVEKSQKAFPPQIRAWVEARKRHRLSHAQVQMARELGLNPGKLGKLSNHGQEPWKAPLPQFIEYLYRKRFGLEGPRLVTPAENWGRSAVAQNPARTALAPKTRGDQAGRGSRRDHA